MSRALMPREPLFREPMKRMIFGSVAGKDGRPKEADGTKRSGLSKQSPDADFQPIRPDEADLWCFRAATSRGTRPETTSYFFFFLRAA